MENTINTIEKFLLHVYSEDIFICAKICTASADKDKEYLYKCLEEVENFIIKLKNELREK